MLGTYCVEGVLVSIFLYTILFLYALRNKDNIIGNAPPLIIHSIIILFCIFSFWDTDYYHYYEILYWIDVNGNISDQVTHLEDLYIYIYQLCQGSYSLFRLCVWGSAYIIFILTLKTLKIYNSLSISYFIILFLPIFSYARVSLGMSIFFYGYSIMISQKKINIKVLIGFVIALLAYYAHKSMIAVICLLPLTLFPYKKIHWFILLPSILVFISLMGAEYISSLSEVDTGDDEYAMMIINSTTNYFTYSTNVGIRELLARLTQYTSLILPVLYMFSNYQVYDGYIKLNRSYSLINYSVLIICASIGIGIISSFFAPICYRIMFMAYIPTIIYLVIATKYKLTQRGIINITLMLAGLYNVYRLLYSLYSLIA